MENRNNSIQSEESDTENLPHRESGVPSSHFEEEEKDKVDI